jgi:hypothetical protein
MLEGVVRTCMGRFLVAVILLVAVLMSSVSAAPYVSQVNDGFEIKSVALSVSHRHTRGQSIVLRRIQFTGALVQRMEGFLLPESYSKKSAWIPSCEKSRKIYTNPKWFSYVLSNVNNSLFLDHIAFCTNRNEVSENSTFGRIGAQDLAFLDSFSEHGIPENDSCKRLHILNKEINNTKTERRIQTLSYESG